MLLIDRSDYNHLRCRYYLHQHHRSVSLFQGILKKLLNSIASGQHRPSPATSMSTRASYPCSRGYGPADERTERSLSRSEASHGESSPRSVWKPEQATHLWQALAMGPTPPAQPRQTASPRKSRKRETGGKKPPTNPPTRQAPATLRQSRSHCPKLP